MRVIKPPASETSRAPAATSHGFRLFDQKASIRPDATYARLSAADPGAKTLSVGQHAQQPQHRGILRGDGRRQAGDDKGVRQGRHCGRPDRFAVEPTPALPLGGEEFITVAVVDHAQNDLPLELEADRDRIIREAVDVVRGRQEDR